MLIIVNTHIITIIAITIIIVTTYRVVGVRDAVPLQVDPREFTKGGFVNGGLAIRHVFSLHTKHET